MKKITNKMLRLLDEDYLIFVEKYKSLEYVGEWPMDLERHDELFFAYSEFWVCKRDALTELRTQAEFWNLDRMDRILVTRQVQGHTVGVVMYPNELALDVATWNVLRIWKLPSGSE